MYWVYLFLIARICLRAFVVRDFVTARICLRAFVMRAFDGSPNFAPYTTLINDVTSD